MAGMTVDRLASLRALSNPSRTPATSVRRMAIEELCDEIERLRGALHGIAQYDPRFEGQHLNNAPSRQELIGRAYDAWKGIE